MAQLKAWFCAPKSTVVGDHSSIVIVVCLVDDARFASGKDDAATDDLTVNDVTEKVAPSTVAPYFKWSKWPDGELNTRANRTRSARSGAFQNARILISRFPIKQWIRGSMVQETPTQVVAKSVQSADAERPTVTAVPGRSTT